MKQSKLQKILSGLVVGGASLLGAVKSDAGLLRVNNNFSIDSPEVSLYHSTNPSVTEGFDSADTEYNVTTTTPRVNAYSVLGDKNLSTDRRPEGSTSDYIIRITGENLTNPVSGNITFSIPTAFTDNYHPVADFYDADGNKVLNNINIESYVAGSPNNTIPINNLKKDQVYTLVVKAVPEPSVIVLLGLGALGFGLKSRKNLASKIK